MDLRKSLLLALGATLLTTGCPGRDDPEDAGTDGGCIGVCTADGGQDAGPNPCAGVSNDGGTVNLYQLREMLPCGQIVTVPNVVVHSITRIEDGGNGSSEAEFYVGAPDDAGVGIFVHKFFNDNPRDYSPLVGDRVNLKGFRYENYVTNNPGGQQHTQHRFGYRHEVGGQFYADGGSGKLQVSFVAEGVPVHVLELTNRAEFAADDGKKTPHDELRGARVHIPGPLYITDEAPSFMLRYNHDLKRPVGEQVFLDPSRDNYEGYVLTDGIVLADTFIRSSCNYRRLAVDAGGEPNQVVFPDGISGVWDSYTMVPFYTCVTGQFYTCVKPGFIPLEDGGYLSDRINVIWPTDCNDVDGGQLVP